MPPSLPKEETHGETGLRRELCPGFRQELGLSRWSDGQESTSSVGDRASIPGSGRSPGEGNGNALHCSCLENPMDRGAWWAKVDGGRKESDMTERLSHPDTHAFSRLMLRKPFFLWTWKLLSRVQLFATPWTVVHGILQARILEWVAFPFSRGSSQLRDWTQVSRIAGRFFTNWAMREAPTQSSPLLSAAPPSALCLRNLWFLSLYLFWPGSSHVSQLDPSDAWSRASP